MSTPSRFRQLVSRISIRLLAFNVLLVFLPAAGVLYLDTFERKLLDAQERSMVQQGRLLAAALADQGEPTRARVEPLLVRLEQRTTARLRVLDRDGWPVADSSRLGPSGAVSQDAEEAFSDVRERWIYRVGTALYRFYMRLGGGPVASVEESQHYSPEQPFRGSEVVAALGGRYGAATRVSAGGQRSLTLYSAIPIRSGGMVTGAVLVSQSTLRLLQDLYEVRLAVFRVFLLSVAVAVVLSLLVSTTIARPLRRLRQQASLILDRRGRLRGRFRPSQRQDEIGDLARALAELSQRLERHVALLENFAADVSHELKNPLASIRTATELVSQTDDPEQRRRFLQMVQQDVARMEDLLATVQEIGLIDTRLDEEAVSPVDLNALLAGVVEGSRLRCDRRLQVELHTPSAPISTLASPDRLVQVFENLLDNAVSFAPQSSTVRVELLQQERWAIVRVSDEGPGIPEANLERVFERFFSHRPAENGAAKRHTGLGLAIVKAIVEGYGGAISVSNRRRGGAVFEIRLELCDLGPS